MNKKTLYVILLMCLCALGAKAQFVLHYNDNHADTLMSDRLSPDTLKLQDISYMTRAPRAKADSDSIAKLPAPKIGDYYYSDGTWSDGGLDHLDSIGCPVWKDVKPAPLSGKTCIGIVFQTDTTRLSAYDKSLGFTHGLVVSCRNGHGDKYKTWTNFQTIDGLAQECLPVRKVASSLYKYLDGNLDTQIIKYMYAPDSLVYLSSFDWILTDFPLKAPTSSTGWYMPASGQLWDMMANLCGHEVAKEMMSWRTIGYDATYYCSAKVSYDVVKQFNSNFALIPSEQREDVECDTEHNENYTNFFCTSVYDDDAVVIFSIGQEGLAEWMADWAVGRPANSRPVLGF